MTCLTWLSLLLEHYECDDEHGTSLRLIIVSSLNVPQSPGLYIPDFISMEILMFKVLSLKIFLQYSIIVSLLRKMQLS